MFTLAGKRREMGLGPYPAVSLARARLKAAECRTAIAEGRDPLEEKEQGCCPDFLGGCGAMHCLAGKRLAQRPPPASVAADHCRVLRPDCQQERQRHRHEPTSCVCYSRCGSRDTQRAAAFAGRIEKILAYSKARGWRSGENPAVWRNHLDSLLPKRQRLTRGHLRAMPYDQVGGFLATLRGIDTISARALELILLTAVRRNEGLGARWSEVDLARALWTIPKERTKSGKEHVVPLSRQALAVLAELHAVEHSPFVFPGRPASKPLSGEALRSLLQTAEVRIHIARFSQQFQGLLRGSYELPEGSCRAGAGTHGWRRNRAGLPQGLRTAEARRSDAGMGRLSRGRGGKGYSPISGDVRLTPATALR